jgi:hypothetical protein
MRCVELQAVLSPTGLVIPEIKTTLQNGQSFILLEELAIRFMLQYGPKLVKLRDLEKDTLASGFFELRTNKAQPSTETVQEIKSDKSMRGRFSRFRRK